MRRTVLAAALATTLLTPVAAHAARHDYRGGCGFVAVNDTTPGEVLGGRSVWNGVVYLLVIATDDSERRLPDPTASVTAWCTLRINYGYEQTVLGPTSGTGVVADAGTIAFTADVTDVVELCTHVRIGNEAEHLVCKPATVTPVIPEPVVALIRMAEAIVCQQVESPCNLLDQILDVADVHVMYVTPGL